MLKAILFIFKYFMRIKIFKEVLSGIGEEWKAENSLERSVKNTILSSMFLRLVDMLTPRVDSTTRSPYPYSKNIVSASSAHGFYWYDVGSASNPYLYNERLNVGVTDYSYNEDIVVGVFGLGELG